MKKTVVFICLVLFLSCSNKKYDEALLKGLNKTEKMQESFTSTLKQGMYLNNAQYEDTKKIIEKVYTLSINDLGKDIDSLAVFASTLKDADKEPYKSFLPLYGKVTELYSILKSGKYNAFDITQRQADISKDIEILKIKMK